MAYSLMKQKNILITGASQGLGRATALKLAELGHQLILLSKNEQQLNQLQDDILAHGWPEPIVAPFNFEVAPWEQYQELAHLVANEFTSLDALILNAAMFGTLTPVEHYDVSIWHKVMQVNLNGAYMLSKAFLPLLKKASDSHLVFVCDQQAEQSKALYGAYGVSKVALTSLSELLKTELEDDSVSVSRYYPGIMNTELRRQAYPAELPCPHPKPDDVVDELIKVLT